MSKKAYLIILDGYGIGKHDKGDALFYAKTPYFDKLLKSNPHAFLKTDGECVGLPSFQTGGSEVGHITIGSGRAVKHLLTKINDQIESGDFFSNEKMKQLFKTATDNLPSRIHFCGMLSDGGIHSFQPHLYGLLEMAKRYKIQKIFLHLFTDGRDVPERSFPHYLKELNEKISALGLSKKVVIATLSGRYFSMDRDNNWDRIAEISDKIIAENNPDNRSVHSLIHQKNGDQSADKTILEYVENFYQNGDESDYYLPPACFSEEGKLQKDDIMINFNYRSDRSRQISEKIVQHIGEHQYGIFGPYCDGAIEIFKFGSETISNTLGEVLEKNNKTQLRISETEKFNHVTFFFSGERKAEFKGESRILVPSPKCKSYAEKPEMSAREQTQALQKFLKNEQPDFIVQNYANADLVGHSGNFEAAKISAEVLDECLSKIIPFAEKKGYQVFVTADHGNSDEMLLADGEPNAGHTKNLVPFIAIHSEKKAIQEKGTLQDIAPSILSEMELEIPKEMTGKNIFE